MAYFHCLIGGGSSGGGYELTVTCDSAFSGTTITCTDGTTTLTQTCPSASPYEVVFEIPNGGEWTVSGTISGQTSSASIDIPDELELIAIPEGSTVIPTDVIQTWLACAGITDKSYTTLNEVLADSTTLLALISDDNASDYLVRSTTWASGLTADSTAMTDIGANNYCAETLLADSTWLSAICNSTYFESVLNVKVPTMTNYTTPSGEVIEDNPNANVSYLGWKAFDNNNSTFFSPKNDGKTNEYIGYIFASNVSVSLISMDASDGVKSVTYDFTIQTYDGSNWTDSDSWEVTTTTTTQTFTKTVQLTNIQGVRLLSKNKSMSTSGDHYINLYTLQFYGRASS